MPSECFQLAWGLCAWCVSTAEGVHSVSPAAPALGSLARQRAAASSTCSAPDCPLSDGLPIAVPCRGWGTHTAASTPSTGQAVKGRPAGKSLRGPGSDNCLASLQLWAPAPLSTDTLPF